MRRIHISSKERVGMEEEKVNLGRKVQGKDQNLTIDNTSIRRKRKRTRNAEDQYPLVLIKRKRRKSTRTIKRDRGQDPMIETEEKNVKLKDKESQEEKFGQSVQNSRFYKQAISTKEK